LYEWWWSIQAGYAAQGWLADDAVLSALACAEKPADIDAVTAAIRAIYLPWLEESARYLQKLVDGSNYPGGTIASAKAFAASKGECVLFVDGLRFDAARRLSAVLETRGCQVAEAMSWTALPIVTATGKAAASPVRTKISGTDDCDDFEPCVSATGQSLKGGYHPKKLLNDNHWKVLERTENGDGHLASTVSRLIFVKSLYRTVVWLVFGVVGVMAWFCRVTIDSH